MPKEKGLLYSYKLNSDRNKMYSTRLVWNNGAWAVALSLAHTHTLSRSVFLISSVFDSFSFLFSKFFFLYSFLCHPLKNPEFCFGRAVIISFLLVFVLRIRFPLIASKSARSQNLSNVLKESPRATSHWRYALTWKRGSLFAFCQLIDSSTTVRRDCRKKEKEEVGYAERDHGGGGGKGGIWKISNCGFAPTWQPKLEESSSAF